MDKVYKILDASRYQGDIDWKKAFEDGLDGAILKTVSTNNREFGGLYIDPYFERNYAECKRLGIPVGAYYYTYAQDKNYADKELALFKKAIEGKTFELPLVVDVEDNLLKPLSANALTDLVEYAAKTIQDWGCYAMVYTYLNYQNTELNMARLAKYDLWLAAYRDVRPTYPAHNIWQYTSSGSLKGVNGRCDLNHCYRDFPTIIKNAGLNGFGKAEPSKLKAEDGAVVIGYMSKGDVLTISTKLDDMGVSYTIKDGYITTEDMSVSEKIRIENECDRLQIVIVDAEEVVVCRECIDHLEKIKQLEKDLHAEVEFKRNYQAEAEQLKKELTAANSALAAERGSNQLCTAENAQLKDKLKKIKEIVGG
ncbi:MAG: hypothetical protein IKU47_08430 [Oscillospiraceae bacterium]|nr:hypothetical protein [Oscillospiraceae bacterium]